MSCQLADTAYIAYNEWMVESKTEAPRVSFWLCIIQSCSFLLLKAGFMDCREHVLSLCDCSMHHGASLFCLIPYAFEFNSTTNFLNLNMLMKSSSMNDLCVQGYLRGTLVCLVLLSLLSACPRLPLQCQICPLSVHATIPVSVRAD